LLTDSAVHRVPAASLRVCTVSPESGLINATPPSQSARASAAFPPPQPVDSRPGWSASVRAQDKMFKIMRRVRVVRLASSLCAILFLVAMDNRRSGRAVECSSDAPVGRGGHQRPASESGSAPAPFLTSGDHVSARATGEQLSQASSSAILQQQQAGKILDFTTAETKERIHSLTPRRLNSTGLMRLVLAPLQNRLERPEQSRAESTTSSEPTRRREGKCVVQGRSRHLGDVLRGE
jgi:hypothetical protein